MLLGRSNDGFIYLFTEPVRVLAVDDDPIMREFAVAQLSHPGGEIVTAFDGQDAWEKLQADEKGFDLVISDLEMPRMTGFNLCEAIRSSPRHAALPVVVITGRDDTFAIDRAYEVGATSFVTKPVNWRLLGYQLRFVLRARRAETDAAGAAGHPDARAAGPAGAARDILPTLAREAEAHLGRIERAAGAQGPQAADELLCAVADLSGLLRRTASIAGVSAAAIADTREEISLGGLLNERIRMAEGDCAARGVAVSFDRPPPTWRVEGDRRLMTQAIDILLLKMMGAADRGADLRVGVTATDDARGGREGYEIALTVEGRVPEDSLDGALLRRIVDAHEGELTLERAGGTQTQARLRLPAARASQAPRLTLPMAGFA